jgi:dihydropyrimidinase
MADEEILVNSFNNARGLGAICTVHAENGELVFHLKQELLKKGIPGSEEDPYRDPLHVKASS